MRVQARRFILPDLTRRTPRGDRVMQGVILSGGIVVLVMLAWVHLGLAALVTPAPPTQPQMVTTVRGYVVTMSTNSALVAGSGNVVRFTVRDAAGRPVSNATVRVHADMTSMDMPVPDATATADTSGHYTARLMFTMAGPWRLKVTVATSGTGELLAAFDVTVRWR